jgi:TonB family protein
MGLSILFTLLLAQANDARPVGPEITPPTLIRKVEPEYSTDARAKRIEGLVKLSVVVDAEGSPVNIKVLSPLEPGLDQRAVQAVQQWRFRPARKSGKTVAVTAVISVDFRLPNPILQRDSPPRTDAPVVSDGDFWWIFN